MFRQSYSVHPYVICFLVATSSLLSLATFAQPQEQLYLEKGIRSYAGNYASSLNSPVHDNPFLSQTSSQPSSLLLQKISMLKSGKNELLFSVVLRRIANSENSNDHSRLFKNEVEVIFSLQNSADPKKVVPLKVVSKKIEIQEAEGESKNKITLLHYTLKSNTIFANKKSRGKVNGKYHLLLTKNAVPNVNSNANNSNNFLGNGIRKRRGQEQFVYKNAMTITNKKMGKPVSILFVVDNSASMYRNDQQNARFKKIFTLLQGEDFLKSVFRVGVYSFAGEVKTILPLGKTSLLNLQQLHSSFSSVAEEASKGSSTSFINALGFLQTLVKKERGDGSNEQFRVVFITDGMPTKPYTGIHRSLDKDVAIYTVGISAAKVGGGRLEYDEKLLRTMAKETGGKFFAGKSEIMESLYQNVLPQKKAFGASTFVSAVKNNFSTNELVRLSIMPLEKQKLFSYKISGYKNGRWLPLKEISAVLVNGQNGEVFFMPLEPGAYKVKASIGRGYSSYAFFNVKKQVAPFYVTTENGNNAHELQLGNLQSGVLQTSYASLHNVHTSFGGDKIGDETAREEVQVGGIGSNNFLRHFVLVGNKNYSMSKSIRVQQISRQLQFVLSPQAAVELGDSVIEASVNAITAKPVLAGVYNAEGLLSDSWASFHSQQSSEDGFFVPEKILRSGLLVSAYNSGSNNAAKKYSVDSSPAYSDAANFNYLASSPAEILRAAPILPEDVSYYVSSIFFEFNKSIFAMPKLIYSRQLEEDVEVTKKTGWAIVSYVLAFSCFMFIVAIVMRLVLRKKKYRNYSNKIAA